MLKIYPLEYVTKFVEIITKTISIIISLDFHSYQRDSFFTFFYVKLSLFFAMSKCAVFIQVPISIRLCIQTVANAHSLSKHMVNVLL